MARIWFPEGAPAYYKDTELEDAAYDKKSLGVWADFRKTGRFAEGLMPELPPKREWCSFDF